MRRARKLYLAMGLALVAMLVAAGAVYAAVTFDPSTGTGFVGKGDVQTALGLNNSQLNQQAGSLTFTSSSTSTTDWTCSKPGSPAINYRSSTTTTTGVVDKIARDNKSGQITGFYLTGYVPGSTTSTTTGDGPVGSCPNAASGFTYDNNAVTGPATTQLFVNNVPLQ